MRRLTLAGALAATLVMSGCSGGSSDSGAGSTKSGQSTQTTGGGAPGANKAQADTGLPTDAELAQARADVKKLSDEQLAGQVVVGFFVGNTPEAARAAMKKNHLGGLIIMGDNLPASGNQTQAAGALSSAIHNEMKASGRDWPAMVGIDQEGGPVQRLRTPVMQLPGGMAMGAANNAAIQTAATKSLGQELRALGINTVMAPDADVTIGAKDPTIGVRSPGSDPQRVAAAVKAEVAGFQTAGVLPVIKHFPGHGSVTADSHVGIVPQTNSVEALTKRDWVPFAQSIAAGAPAVMTGHISLKAVDGNVPATLSPKVINDQLRKKLGFKGLVITDAMNMGAIVQRYDRGNTAAISALRAGADVILMPQDTTGTVKAIAEGMRTGQLLRSDIEDKAARMIATLRHHDVKQPAPGAVGSHDAQAENLAKASITQLGGHCGAVLAGRSVNVTGASADERSRFTKALAAQGISTSPSGTRVTLIPAGTYNAGKASAGGGSEASQAGSAAVGASTSGIQITLGEPYALAQRPTGAVGLAAYGNTDATFQVLAQVLAGKVKPAGTLPIAVGTDPVGASACK